MEDSAAYQDFTKRFALLISKHPDLITTTLSNIFTRRLISNKTHGDLAETGRRGIPPGVFFRLLSIGYFEGIGSQRGIAWRCEDSLSLKRFLGYEPHEETPDHSSLSRIRRRLPLEVFHAVHRFVLEVLSDHQLLDGTTLGVDSTLLEANAAMNRHGRMVHESVRDQFRRPFSRNAPDTPAMPDRQKGQWRGLGGVRHPSGGRGRRGDQNEGRPDSLRQGPQQTGS